MSLPLDSAAPQAKSAAGWSQGQGRTEVRIRLLNGPGGRQGPTGRQTRAGDCGRRWPQSAYDGATGLGQVDDGTLLCRPAPAMTTEEALREPQYICQPSLCNLISADSEFHLIW